MTRITMSILANECLFQLLEHLKQKDVGNFQTQRISLDCALEGSCEAWDPSARIGLAIGRDYLSGPDNTFIVGVRKLNCKYVTVPLRMDDVWDGTSVDFISRRWVAPAMQYLAELLVPSRMPSDAPDYVYMGV